MSDMIVRSSAKDSERLEGAALNGQQAHPFAPAPVEPGEASFRTRKIRKSEETMQRHIGWIIAVMVAALPLTGCGKSTAKPPPEAPAIMEKQESGIGRITLKGRAAERLGIEFVEVAKSGRRLEAPYNALLYDASGGEWVFVSPQPNVFMRTAIKVELIEGDKIYYSQGPAAGTKLVTSGIAQLYGIEFGVGK